MSYNNSVNAREYNLCFRYSGVFVEIACRWVTIIREPILVVLLRDAYCGCLEVVSTNIEKLVVGRGSCYRLVFVRLQNMVFSPLVTCS